MDDGVAADIAVMAHRQDGRAALEAALGLDPRRAGDDRLAKPFADPGPGEEAALRGVVEGDGRMGGGGAGETPQAGAGKGDAAIDDQALAGGTHLEGQAAGMGLGREVGRRRAAGIGDQDRRPGLDALVAAMRGAGQRRAAHVVIGKHGGKLVGRGVAGAVEAGEAAVALAEITQHRHHPVDRRQEDAGGLLAAGGEGLAERQQVEQHLEDGGRVAAGMAAVGQDLADEFLVEPLGRLLEEAILLRHRERRGGERDHGAQPRQALRPVIGGAAEVADLAGQRAHEAAIEGEVAALEDQRRLGQPRNDAAGDDAGLPGDRVGAGGLGDPLVD